MLQTELCPPKTWPLIPVKQSYLKKRVFIDVIKLRLGSYWNRVGPESNDWCPYKRKEKKMWTHRCMGKKTLWQEMQRVNAVMPLQDKKVKGCQPPGRSQHRFFPTPFKERAEPCQHLDFGLLVPRTKGKIFFFYWLSHPVCVTLLWQPQEAKTTLIFKDLNCHHGPPVWARAYGS